VTENESAPALRQLNSMNCPGADTAGETVKESATGLSPDTLPWLSGLRLEVRFGKARTAVVKNPQKTNKTKSLLHRGIGQPPRTLGAVSLRNFRFSYSGSGFLNWIKQVARTGYFRRLLRYCELLNCLATSQPIVRSLSTQLAG
jgi:hypothetical protein